MLTKKYITYLVFGLLFGIISASMIAVTFAGNSGILGGLFKEVSTTTDSNGDTNSNYRFFGENIQDVTITTKEIKDGTITSKDIADATIVSDDIENNTVQSVDIQDGTILQTNINPQYTLWNKDTNNNIYYTNGNVGIGTNNPAYKLHIVGGDANFNGVTIGKGGGALTSNTAIGYNALRNNVSGQNNIAIGINAGNGIITGSNNIAIGNNTIFSSSQSNVLNIGNTITGTIGTNKTIRIDGDMIVKDIQSTQPIALNENSDPKSYVTKAYAEKVTNNGNLYLQEYNEVQFDTNYTATNGGFVTLKDVGGTQRDCTSILYINDQEITKARSKNENDASFGVMIPHGSVFKVTQIAVGGLSKCNSSKLFFAAYGKIKQNPVNNPNTIVGGVGTLLDIQSTNTGSTNTGSTNTTAKPELRVKWLSPAENQGSLEGGQYNIQLIGVNVPDGTRITWEIDCFHTPFSIYEKNSKIESKIRTGSIIMNNNTATWSGTYPKVYPPYNDQGTNSVLMIYAWFDDPTHGKIKVPNQHWGDSDQSVVLRK